jgi:hypothetical protein
MEGNGNDDGFGNCPKPGSTGVVGKGTLGGLAVIEE